MEFGASKPNNYYCIPRFLKGAMAGKTEFIGPGRTTG
jgi:hypothetical protein